MTKDSCFQLGKITKTHGLKGEMQIWLDVDVPEDYEDLDSVLLDIKGELIPHLIEKIQIRGTKSIVKFEEIDSIESAQRLVGADLYLPMDVLPTLEENQFYYHEITDFQVIDEQKGALGIVKAVYTSHQQDLIAMEYQDVEVLIPINDDIVKSVNRDKKELYTNLPDGLLEVYLEP
ncbi:MAG: ribosome maturation factor RimM [Spirosomataceae bacterium]